MPYSNRRNPGNGKRRIEPQSGQLIFDWAGSPDRLPAELAPGRLAGHIDQFVAAFTDTGTEDC